MYNFDNLLTTFVGTESSVTPKELTVEEEAQLDIAMESELDTTQEAMYAAGLEEVADQAKAFRVMLLMRDATISQNSGRSFESICKDWYMDINQIGMEAITDVAARHAYAGIANLKSLISRAITCLQNLIGFNVTFRKVCRGIETKAKAELKALAKYSGKDMSKLKKSMPDYKGVIEKLFTSVDTISTRTKDKKSVFVFAEFISTQKKVENYFKNASTSTSKKHRLNNNKKDCTARLDAIKDELEKLRDNTYYDKSDTTEYEESEAYSKCVDALNKIKSLTSTYKSNEAEKIIKTTIDDLGKMRKNMVADKKFTNEAAIKEFMESLSLFINVLSNEQKLMSGYSKKILQVCDDAFTMSRSIQASL